MSITEALNRLEDLHHQINSGRGWTVFKEIAEAIRKQQMEIEELKAKLGASAPLNHETETL